MLDFIRNGRTCQKASSGMKVRTGIRAGGGDDGEGGGDPPPPPGGG